MSFPSCNKCLKSFCRIMFTPSYPYQMKMTKEGKPENGEVRRRQDSYTVTGMGFCNSCSLPGSVSAEEVIRYFRKG